MLVLLPPSETKSAPTRGRVLNLSSLSFPDLTAARVTVLAALVRASGAADAHTVLGVPASRHAEVGRNVTLPVAPTAPAGEIYQGVLYDALDLRSLDAASRRRANRRLVIASALFGAVRLTDRIPAYRLSMAVTLPETGPLARHWRAPLAPVLSEAAGSGSIVDTRSSTYAAAWTPSGELAARWVHVRVPGATHMAKHTRGLVARAVSEMTTAPRTVTALATALSESFTINLTPPAKPGKPWLLDVTA